MNQYLDPPLQGRDAEIETLFSSLSQATQAKGNLVIVSGEAGIGKTRLVDEFLRKASNLDCTITTGRCVPGMTTPYLAFEDAIRNLESSSPTKVHQEFDKETQIESAEEVFYHSDPSYLPFRLLDLLKRIAISRTLIVRLEDLHWADSQSVQLLHLLARNIRNLKVLLIGTYRTEDLQPREGEKPHPLMEHLNDMKREGLVLELTLTQLGLQHMTDLAEGILGGKADPFLIERIAKEGHGNPLFVLETIKLLLMNGSITFREGAWRASKEGVLEMPSTVKEVVTRRLEKLDPKWMRILECAAAIGERFDPHMVGSCLHIISWDLLDTLEGLDRTEKLIMADGMVYKFSHETVRRVTYERVSPPRRRELHRLIGAEIERGKDVARKHGELSYHFFNAQDAEKCVHYSILAGDETLARGGAVEAIPLFQRVIDIGPELNGYASVEAHALEGLGDAFNAEGDANNAVVLFEKARMTNISGKDRARVLRKLAECWGPLKLGEGNKTKALELCEEARRTPGIDDDELGEMASLLTVVHMLEGDWSSAKEQAVISEQSFRRANIKNKLSLQLVFNSDVFISIGDLDKALAMVQEAEVLNKDIQNPVAQSEIDFHYGMIFLHRGDVEKAMSHYESYAEMTKKFGYDSALSIVRFYESILMAMVGEHAKALQLAAQSREYAMHIGSKYLLAAANSAMSHINYEMRRWEDCRQYAEEALKIKEGFDPNMKAPTIGMISVAAAESALVENRSELADKHFNDAINMFRLSAVGKLMEALSLSWYGDALYRQGKVQEARENLQAAEEIFSMLNNQEQIKKCRGALISINDL